MMSNRAPPGPPPRSVSAPPRGRGSDSFNIVPAPETQYTRSGDVNIAYQVVGRAGRPSLVPAFAQHLELSWEEPYRRAWLEALAAEYRLIVLDKRGTGLSDRVEGAAPVEVRMDDCRAVLDAAAKRAAILTAGDASDLALVFAATYPERVHALVLWSGQYRGTWAPDYPWAMPREKALREIDEMERRWPTSLLEMVELGAPSLDPAEREAFARVLRLSVSPGSAAAYQRLALDTDVRGVLTSVRVPVLVMHLAGAPDEGAAEFVASRLPAGEFVSIDRPGPDSRRRRYGASPRRTAPLRRSCDRGRRNRARPGARNCSFHRHRRFDSTGRRAR